MDEYVIEVDALRHRFGRREVLAGVDMHVRPGSVTALLGRNGEGKTTLLRLLVGFLRPKPGHVRVLGLDPARAGPDIRRRVGYVPDRLELPTWMRVADWFRFLEPFYPTWSRAEETRLLGALDLDPAAPTKSLSKGQRAKHALIAALAHEPRLLLLDEPFSGLDPLVRDQVLGAVLGHLKDDGRTVVVVTHSITDVERVADRVALMEQGRIRFDEDVEDLRRRSARLAVTLDETDAVWQPPGDPAMAWDGRDVVLTYLDWQDGYEAALRADGAVRHVRRLDRDLNDLFLAAVRRRREEEPCAVSAN